MLKTRKQSILKGNTRAEET